MAIIATGGTETIVDGYKYHTFLTSGTLEVATGGDIEILVVAGGGGGGYWLAGGGGAGGVLYDAALSVSTQTYTVTVGNGGLGDTTVLGTGGKGEDSVFSSLTANGGGGGGTRSSSPEYIPTAGADGGSGGGASGGDGTLYAGSTYAGGSGTPAGQGNNGGSAIFYGWGSGGGGGAGEVGESVVAGEYKNKGGDGGDGVNTYSDLLIAVNAGVDILGTRWIAGGGGGSAYKNEGYLDGGAGGKGGGGKGADGDRLGTGNGGVGVANTGSGGGAGGFSVYTTAGYGEGGNGGSGIVIIAYLLVTAVITTSTTLITDVSCTFTGEIAIIAPTDSVTIRGFCYMIGSSGDPTVTDSIISNTSNEYSIGVYSNSTATLLSNTAYRVRAYVKTASGLYFYGDTLGFTTLAQKVYPVSVNFPRVGYVAITPPLQESLFADEISKKITNKTWILFFQNLAKYMPDNVIRWIQVDSSFTATPVSTTELTTTADMSGSIFIGTVLKFLIGGSYKSASVANITAILITVDKAVLTGDVLKIWRME